MFYQDSGDNVYCLAYFPATGNPIKNTTKLAAIEALASSAGVLKNDGAGNFSYVSAGVDVQVSLAAARGPCLGHDGPSSALGARAALAAAVRPLAAAVVVAAALQRTLGAVSSRRNRDRHCRRWQRPRAHNRLARSEGTPPFGSWLTAYGGGGGGTSTGVTGGSGNGGGGGRAAAAPRGPS